MKVNAAKFHIDEINDLFDGPGERSATFKLVEL
jgi:hypothetical protein